MFGIDKKTDLVGKLVSPNNIASPATKAIFSNNKFGLITRADWDLENRILYIEILIGDKKIIEREYNSVSNFWNFWDEAKA